MIKSIALPTGRALHHRITALSIRAHSSAAQLLACIGNQEAWLADEAGASTRSITALVVGAQGSLANDVLWQAFEIVGNGSSNADEISAPRIRITAVHGIAHGSAANQRGHAGLGVEIVGTNIDTALGIVITAVELSASWCNTANGGHASFGVLEVGSTNISVAADSVGSTAIIGLAHRGGALNSGHARLRGEVGRASILATSWVG